MLLCTCITELLISILHCCSMSLHLLLAWRWLACKVSKIVNVEPRIWNHQKSHSNKYKKKLQKLQKGWQSQKVLQNRTSQTRAHFTHIGRMTAIYTSQYPCEAAEHVCDVEMPVLCYHPYHPCLSTFSHCHPYLLLQFLLFFILVISFSSTFYGLRYTIVYSVSSSSVTNAPALTTTYPTSSTPATPIPGVAV